MSDLFFMQKQSTSFVLPYTSVEMTPLRKEEKKSKEIQELGQRLVEHFLSFLLSISLYTATYAAVAR